MKEINEFLEENILEQIKSQASHIMRTYVNHEREEKMIMLASEWFLKGVMEGLQAKSNDRPKPKRTLADLHNNE